jgi:hypothetical protein
MTGVIDETSTTMEEGSGKMVTIDFKPGGAGIAVTEGNNLKEEYVDLISHVKALQGPVRCFHGRLPSQRADILGPDHRVCHCVMSASSSCLFAVSRIRTPLPFSFLHLRLAC